MAEVLDIVVRQRGARRVAKDIATIGTSAQTASAQLKKFQLSIRGTATAFTQASAGANKFQAACQKTTRCTAQASAGLGKTRAGLSGVGAGAAVAGAALTAGFLRPLIAATNAAGDFQQAMNLTGVLLNVDRTSEAFKELERTALELGRTTQFTAVQAAEGLQFLAKAGFESNEALQAIPETLKIAAAANIDLGTAADITTNILKGFRLNIEELPAAVDILAATFSSSNVDLLELSASFKKVGPVASKFGQDFGDIAAVLGGLGDAGVKAEESGTALRRIFINLQQDAAKSNSILKKFNISILDSAGNMRPLIDIFTDLSKAPLEAGQEIDLFGARALAAAGILDDSEASIQAFAVAVRDSVGRAAEIGEARLFGFNGATIQLKSALEGLGIAIAQSGLLDFLTTVIGGFTKAARAIAQLPRPILALIGAVAGLAGALGALLIPIGLIAIGVSTLAPLLAGVTFAGIVASIGGFLLAIAPVAAAIAVAVGAFTLLKDVEFELGGATLTLGAIVSETFSTLGDAFSTLADEASLSFTLLKNDFSTLVADLFGLSKEAETALPSFEEFAASGIASFEILGRVIGAFFVRTIKGLTKFASNLTDFVSAIPEAIKAAFDFDEATNPGQILAGKFREGFISEFEGFGDEVAAIVDDATGKAQAALGIFGRSDFATRAAARVTGGPAGAVTEPEAAPGAPAPQPDPEPTNRFTEAQLRALGAVNALTAAFAPGTQAVLKMNAALVTLDTAVEENVIDAERARAIFEKLRATAGEEFLAGILPVNAALRDRRVALEELTVASQVFGLTEAQQAAAAEEIIEQNDRRLLQLEAFKEGLTGVQAAQLGVTEGLRVFSESFGTQFDIISSGVTKLAGTITGQLTKAIQEGEFSFQQFALTVVNAIQEIIVQLLVQIALQAALKVLGGPLPIPAAGGASITPAQEGATGSPGQAFLVGEKGPELFVPQQTGEIIPSAQSAAMMGAPAAPPQVNVQVVNVDDNSSVPDAMSTQEGEQVILNVIARNKNTLREVIA